MRTRKLGEYFFGRHYFQWGIWQVDYVGENGATSGRHIMDVPSYPEALKTTWKPNGWGEPKYINPNIY